MIEENELNPFEKKRDEIIILSFRCYDKFERKDERHKLVKCCGYKRRVEKNRKGCRSFGSAMLSMRQCFSHRRVCQLPVSGSSEAILV